MFAIERRVGYAETDQMGAAHHSRVYIWFEEARTALLRDLGRPYGELEKAGVMFPVAEGGAQYRSFARFDANLAVSIERLVVRGASLRFEYVIRDGETLIAEGFTEHACIDPAGKVRRLPKDLRDFFAELARKSAPA